MSNLAEYTRTLTEWRQKYGVPPPPRVYGLNLRSIACVKKGCGTTKRTQRHHTGNDFWFACMLPDHFAVRYLQFRPEDTAYLCEHHHKAAHKIYKELMIKVKAELKQGGLKIVTKVWAEHWMHIFRNRFNKWVNYPAHKKRRKHARPRPDGRSVSGNIVRSKTTHPGRWADRSHGATG